MRLLIVLCAVLSLGFVGPAGAQSAWEQLNGKGATTTGATSASDLLSLPDDRLETNGATADDAQSRPDYVFTYNCHNPAYPRCMFDLEFKPRMADKQNCREVVRAYLQMVQAYNRCVDRRSRQHMRNVVEHFNCLARNGENCPGVYGRN